MIHPCRCGGTLWPTTGFLRRGRRKTWTWACRECGHETEIPTIPLKGNR